MRQLSPVLLGLSLHVRNVTLDVGLDEAQFLLVFLRQRYFFKHDLLLFFYCFLDAHNFVGLMLVGEDAINTKDLQVFLAEGFEFLIVFLADLFAGSLIVGMNLASFLHNLGVLTLFD